MRTTKTQSSIHVNYSGRRITLSRENRKLGHIPSFSFPPVVTCRPKAPCARSCYAQKAMRLFPSARKAWQRNLRAYRADPVTFWKAFSAGLEVLRPSFFRFMVSGDIPDRSFLKGILGLARAFPKTRFLLFTKQYSFVSRVKPPANLQIILSAWPGLRLPRSPRFPIAYMQDGSETRAAGALECPGNCESCGVCWQLGKTGRNVVFAKH